MGRLFFRALQSDAGSAEGGGDGSGGGGSGETISVDALHVVADLIDHYEVGDFEYWLDLPFRYLEPARGAH